MNLQATIEQQWYCLQCGRFLAGGPGSGCHGPSCGRPAGHTGAHGKMKEKDRPQAMKDILKERRKNFQKSLHKDKYQRADPKAKGKGHVKEIKTIKYKGKKVQVKVLRPATKGRPPVPMGKSNSNRVLKGVMSHPQKGLFTEDPISRTIVAGNRITHVHEAEKDPNGKGVTLFTHQYKDSATKSHVIIEEHKRSVNREIESTKVHEFKSSSLAKSFMRDRYGIKDVKWSSRKANKQ